MPDSEAALTAPNTELDTRDSAWYVDKAVQVLVFLGGISAIIFIIGIFVFITREGFGFITDTLDVKEFLGSPNWRPTSVKNPTYGALALIAGTASVTDWPCWSRFRFPWAPPFSLANSPKGKLRESLKILVELLAAIPSVVWGFIGLSIMNP